ncbi:hypothetical protein MHH70_12510 [Metasolibacillus sp. FSL H7-0170]|uniref:DUF7210 family protein n=1 Tax=Metasolibacillus sp. FSL H7-0170 TaxID=2921431 RepID=UPI0031586EDC
MIRAKHNIRHDGVTYLKGAIIEGLTKEDSERLVKLKAAEFVITPQEELRKQKIDNNSHEIPPELFEELSAELDDLYNADELKRAATEVGVDLTGISRKSDVIAAIINQGKADELLEDDPNAELNE